MIHELNRLLDLFTPQPAFCLVCGEPLAVNTVPSLCYRCTSLVHPGPSSSCLTCGEHTRAWFCRRCQVARPFRRVVSVGIYDGLLAALIKALKYEGRVELSRPLGTLLAQRVQEEGVHPQVIVPVPIHRKRYRQRGFNQAGLLSRWAAQELGVPYRPLLVRRKNTRPLSGLDPNQRAAALQQAFALKRRPPAGCHLLLVDDIFTTGTTVTSCANVLKAAGCQQVSVAVLGRATRPLAVSG